MFEEGGEARSHCRIRLRHDEDSWLPAKGLRGVDSLLCLRATRSSQISAHIERTVTQCVGGQQSPAALLVVSLLIKRINNFL